MKAGSPVPTRVIALLAAVCAVLLGWSIVGFVLPFQRETGMAVLDTYIGGYDHAAVVRMQRLLSDNESARAILRAMYLGPELVLPALLTALLLLVFIRIGPIDAWFGRKVHPLVGALAFALPILYGASDYAENIASLIAFADKPSTAFAAQVLPWTTRLKFASLAVSLILIARIFILRGGARNP